jgi:hypothetical protein
VQALGHDALKKELYVQFKSGGTYVYSDINQVAFNILRTASSIGRAINALKENHQVVKLGEDRNIFAWTAPSGSYPQYLSINERSGKIEITVREIPVPLDPLHNSLLHWGPTVMLELPREELVKLARALSQFLPKEVVKPISKDYDAAFMARAKGVDNKPDPVIFHTKKAW